MTAADVDELHESFSYVSPSFIKTLPLVFILAELLPPQQPETANEVCT